MADVERRDKGRSKGGRVEIKKKFLTRHNKKGKHFPTNIVYLEVKK